MAKLYNPSVILPPMHGVLKFHGPLRQRKNKDLTVAFMNVAQFYVHQDDIEALMENVLPDKVKKAFEMQRHGEYAQELIDAFQEYLDWSLDYNRKNQDKDVVMLEGSYYTRSGLFKDISWEKFAEYQFTLKLSLKLYRYEKEELIRLPVHENFKHHFWNSNLVVHKQDREGKGVYKNEVTRSLASREFEDARKHELQEQGEYSDFSKQTLAERYGKPKTNNEVPF